MDALIRYMLSEKPWISAALIFGGFYACHRAQLFFEKGLEREDDTNERRANIHLTLSVVKWAAVIIIFAFTLQYNGIDVPGIITGLGVAGIVVGFALQDVLKDLIMGASIAWDNYFVVGDVVRFGEIEGTVLSFNFKTTKIRDIKTGNIATVSNRNISQIELLSDWLDVLVPVSYEVPLGIAKDLVGQVAQRARAIEGVSSVDSLGTQELRGSSVAYLLRLHCEPATRYATKRAAQDVIQAVFDENGVSLPYERLEVVVDTKPAEQEEPEAPTC